MRNNTKPQNIDKNTSECINKFLDSIQKYRMIEKDKERLKYIYDKKKAGQIKNLIPDKKLLFKSLKNIKKGNLVELVGTAVYTAVNTIENNISFENETELEYLRNNWELDDEADTNLHEIRKEYFNYMVDMSRKNKSIGDLTLNEETIKKFVEYKNNDNLSQQIQLLENNKDTYKYFGSYWLLLAECYYKNKEYQKCLDCIDEYENLGCDIFRKDYDFAKTLTLAIASAAEIQPENTYINTAERYLKLMNDNVKDDEWELKYFEAVTYIDLYSRIEKTEYVKSMYEIIKNNIIYLASEQKKLNEDYLKKEKRKIGLPQIYEPLALNCDLLFSVADKINLSQSDKKEIDDILAVNSDNPVFWTEPVRNKFSFSPSKTIADNAKFNHDRIILPVSLVSENSKIKVTVTSRATAFTNQKMPIKF